MYLSHYGLSKKPFEISPDPDFLWLGESHREGLAILKYGILENKGFLLITGEVGTGKTALIRSIEKEVQARAIVVTIPDPGMSLMDFYNFMASELHMDRNFKNKGEFLIHFKKLILNAFSSYRRVLLIIDESQRLNHELLEEIRLLSNIDLAGKVLINIFFVGQTEFRQILAREENRAVRQRITVSYHLPPLTPDEVAKYIAHRLSVAGASREIFTPDALQAVYRFTKGFPRLINIVCDHALMSGYVRGLDRVDAKIVRECGEELRITTGAGMPSQETRPSAEVPAKKAASPPAPAERPQPRTARSILFFAAFVLLLGVGWHFWGDSVSEELARWGKGRELRRAQSSTAGESAESLTRVPPLPVESGPREPKPAEAAEGATPAASPRASKSTSAPGSKAEAKEQPSASVPPKMEPRTVPPPPAIAAETAAKPAPPAPAPAPAPAALPPAEPFKLKDFVVYFTQNSAEVPLYANDVLATAVALLKGNPGTSAIIEGHTDSTGDPGYNKIVAENRAASVRTYLVERGVEPSRLTVSAFGSDKPIDTNSTSEGRSKNRRVVIRIVPSKAGG
ncbi:MAG: AAA family ATPase [Hyphomicrobiales bacterium]